MGGEDRVLFRGDFVLLIQDDGKGFAEFLCFFVQANVPASIHSGKAQGADQIHSGKNRSHVVRRNHFEKRVAIEGSVSHHGGQLRFRVR